ncbi:hypothetical protein STEG23_025864, partial [Scotinomys teguina]
MKFVGKWMEVENIILSETPEITSHPGSKDLQNVNITLSILFRLVASQVPHIYTSIDEDYDERVLQSITTEILKSVVACFDAGELITQRELVTRQFTEAGRAKQVPEQEAERARFVVEKAEQRKKAVIISAE